MCTILRKNCEWHRRALVTGMFALLLNNFYLHIKVRYIILGEYILLFGKVVSGYHSSCKCLLHLINTNLQCFGR